MWSTIATERTVIVVVRTMTTVAWLMDVIPELLADLRIHLVFTVHQGSVFQVGVEQAVHNLGGLVMPWEQAIATTFDLAVAASYSDGLQELRSPLLILPHGPGYTRVLRARDDSVLPVPRLSGRTVPPTTVALTHEQQRTQFTSSLTDDIRTVVVGDPCRDRLVASLADRGRYRAALGLTAHQRLIVISSTWGPDSLIAARPTLPLELLAQLPCDEFVIAAILHANVWIGHGPLQLRLWLKQALDAGLRLIPYFEGWRGTVVAADALIGDHGSVTFYAATLGIPVIQAAFSDDEVVSGTPLHDLGNRAPRLPEDRRIRDHVDRLGFQLAPDRYQDLSRQAFALQGEALAAIRRVIYELIHLDLPSKPTRTLPVALPVPELRSVSSHIVTAKITKHHDKDVRQAIALERRPVIPELSEDVRSHRLMHLVVEESENDRRRRENADVLVAGNADHHQSSSPLEVAIARTEALGRDFPGSGAVGAEAGEGVLALSSRDNGSWIARWPVASGIVAAQVASAFYLTLGRRGRTDAQTYTLLVSAGVATAHVVVQRSAPKPNSLTVR